MGERSDPLLSFADWPKPLRPLLQRYGLERITKVSIDTLGYHPCMIRDAGEAGTILRSLKNDHD